MHPDDKVLSLGDVLLRRSDVDLLTGPHWLNDQVKYLYYICMLHMLSEDLNAPSARLTKADNMVQVISFYFEYLTRESGIANDATLLPASATFLLLHGSGCLYPYWSRLNMFCSLSLILSQPYTLHARTQVQTMQSSKQKRCRWRDRA